MSSFFECGGGRFVVALYNWEREIALYMLGSSTTMVGFSSAFGEVGLYIFAPHYFVSKGGVINKYLAKLFLSCMLF